MAPGKTDDATLAERLQALSSSILSDALGGQGVVAPGLIRFSGTGTAAGHAITADCDEGSLEAVFAALELAKAGDFLCIKGGGDTAYLGDLLAANLARRGMAGAVVDGLVRDRDRIADAPLTIMARGLTPINRRAKGPGRPMVPVAIGGVTISPGDWVIADSDGVIVIPQSEVARAIAAADHNARVEARIGELVRQGVPVGDAVPQALRELAGS